MIDILLFVISLAVLFGFLALTFKEPYFGFIGGILGLMICTMIYADPDGLFVTGNYLNSTDVLVQATTAIDTYILFPVFLTLSCFLLGIAKRWG